MLLWLFVSSFPTPAGSDHDLAHVHWFSVTAKRGKRQPHLPLQQQGLDSSEIVSLCVIELGKELGQDPPTSVQRLSEANKQLTAYHRFSLFSTLSLLRIHSAKAAAGERSVPVRSCLWKVQSVAGTRKSLGAQDKRKGVPCEQMAASLFEHVCIVTGASRGIGKGIALQLSEAGATVYITGRRKETLEQTAQEVQSRGGKCVPVVCDSTKEEDIKLLFDRVQREQKGRLDILVNNAYAGVQAILENRKKKFWECSPSFWDDINNTGLRGHYICSVYAARMMVPAQRGLIVVISSAGGFHYIFNVPYGVGKEACDRLAVDCSIELRKHGVACVSLWPGTVLTETIQEQLSNNILSDPEIQMLQKMFVKPETPELSGKCIVSLATDPKLMKLSGRIHMTCDLARRYGLRDVNGNAVVQFTSLRNLINYIPSMAWLSRFIPGFIRIPKWILTLSASKF